MQNLCQHFKITVRFLSERDLFYLLLLLGNYQRNLKRKTLWLGHNRNVFQEISVEKVVNALKNSDNIQVKHLNMQYSPHWELFKQLDSVNELTLGISQ